MMHRALGVVSALLLVPVPALAQTSTSLDAKVQAPELAPPQRGSLAGQLSGVVFGPGDVARGAFSLPSPFVAPQEKGALLAAVFPSYSSENGIGEWGVGWHTSLAITRTRVSGDLDFATDDLAGPFGRLVRGTDGAFYPVGFSSEVRVTLSSTADVLTAYLPDGTVMTFGGSARVTTSRGTYSWNLTDVRTVAGRRTRLAWAPNSSGRLFLTAVSYGGVEDDFQYAIELAYEPLAVEFEDYRSGLLSRLDQRVKTVTMKAKGASAGALEERWHYDLGYLEEGLGPAFLLANVQQVFRSGEAPPPTAFRYGLSRDHLRVTPYAPAPKVASIFAALGWTALQPDKSTLLDLDQDGQLDIELAKDYTLARQTDTGFVLESLSPAPPGAVYTCRRTVSAANPPRLLAQLGSGSGEETTYVVDLTPNAYRSATTFRACSRLGTALATQTLTGDWGPSSTIRLVDANRDHRPDLVRVKSGAYQILPNTSDAASAYFGFGTMREGTLWPAFTPNTAWVLDVNGDGIADLIARSSTDLWVWFGRGNLEFESTGRMYELRATGGALVSPSGHGLTFVDANRDGLVDIVLSRTSGNNTSLLVNTGISFQEVPVPALASVDSFTSKPVVADVRGSGNTEITFQKNGQGFAVALDEADTGLLVGADDGRGTSLTFEYGRAKPSPGARSRQAVLSRLTVRSSGRADVIHSYDYAGPYTHAVGKFLVGFNRIEREDGPPDAPLAVSWGEFHNADAWSGVPKESGTRDLHFPGLERFSHQAYDDVLFQGVPWKRLSSVESGWRTTAAPVVTVKETTAYLNYERDFCPQRVQKESVSGTLLTTKHFVDLPAFGQALSCLVDTITEKGTHTSDEKLNFEYQTFVQLNEKGLPDRVESVTGAERLVLQSVGYTPDWRIQTISSPGKGTTTFDWPAGTHLLNKITLPDTSTVEVIERHPGTGAPKLLRTARGAHLFDQHFEFDGLERLMSTWDDLGTSSHFNPDSSLAYAWATASAPAAISSSTLVDSATMSVREQVDLLTASGEPVASASRIPEGWAFGSLTWRDPSAGRTTSSLRHTLAASSAVGLDFTSLFAGADQVAFATSGPFDVKADDVTAFHQGVVRQVTGTLSIDAATGTLVRNARENDAHDRTVATDASGRVLTSWDEAGTAWQFTYDALGRLRKVTLPDGKAHKASFDGHGRVSRVERDDIATIEYAFEPGTGLPSEKRFYTPGLSLVRSVGFAYDGIGRPITETHTDAASGPPRVFTRFYDGATPAAPAAKSMPGVLSAITGAGFSKLFTFREDGKLSQRTVSIGSWRTVRTTLDYLDSGDVGTRTVELLDGAGQPISSSTRRQVYDLHGRLQSLQLAGGSSPQPPQTTIYLSDEPRAAESFSYARAWNDLSHLRGPITLNGVTYPKGIGAHSASEVTFDLAGLNCTTFQADVGLDDAIPADSCGAVTFEVHADGTKLFDSGLMRASSPTRPVSLDVSGKRLLKLAVTLGDGNNYCDHADWAAARLTCSPDAVAFRYGPDGELASARFASGGSVGFSYDALTRRLVASQQSTAGAFSESAQVMNARGLVDAESFTVESSTLAITGPTVPDVAGSFARSGSQDGVPAYRRVGLVGGKQYFLYRYSFDYGGNHYTAWYLTTSPTGYPSGADPFWFSYSPGLADLSPAQGASGTARPAAGIPLVRAYDYSPERTLEFATDSETAYAYTFDPSGLPESISKNGVTRPITRQGPILTAGNVTYTFDAIGRTIARSSPSLSITYGPDGQIASASNGASTWSLVHDENGQRLAKYAGGTPVAAYLDEGFLDSSGLFEPVAVGGRTVALWKAGTLTPLSTDLRGSVMADAGARTLASPFGQRDVHPSMAAVIDYVEKGFDADLGFVRMGVRDYDPALNRFTTPDPLFLEQLDASLQSPKEGALYGYALADPVLHADFSGTRVYVVGYGVYSSAGAPPPFYPKPDPDRSFQRAAESYKALLESQPGFDHGRDRVTLIPFLSLNDLKSEVETQTKSLERAGYGKTAAFALFSHNGERDGPVAFAPTERTAPLGLPLQFSPSEWKSIDFNFGDRAVAIFFGCHTLPFSRQFLSSQRVSSVVGAYTYTAFSGSTDALTPIGAPGTPVYAVPTLDNMAGVASKTGYFPGLPWTVTSRNGNWNVGLGVPVPAMSP